MKKLHLRLRAAALLCAGCVPWAAGAAGLVAAWGNHEYGQTCLPPGVGLVRAVAAGWNHSLALRTDGTVAAWGGNDYAQAMVPPGLSNVVAIAAGRYASFALKTDGTLTGWGSNLAGQLSLPPDLGPVRAISAGGPRGSHVLALRADGTVAAWGAYLYNPVWTPAGLSNVVAISASQSLDLALKADGTVVAWGEGSCLTNVPAGLHGVLAVAAGDAHAYALQADGTVVAWGDACAGDTNPPPVLTGIEAVADGLALKTDGTVVAWGDNGSGQADVPAGLVHVTAIAAGAGHSLAIVPEGPVRILQGPADQERRYSSNVTFSVQAVGLAPLGYQWYFNGAVLEESDRVSGVHTDTLKVLNLDFSDAGRYSVVVSNGLGSVLSPGAVLTLVDPPWIVENPVGGTVRAGGSWTLTVQALGAQPLEYQWQLNGAALPGASASSLYLVNVQPGQSGAYSVWVSNQYGVVTSAVAQLTVTDSAPYIVRQPGSVLVPVGGGTTMSVNAAGSLPLSYQWRCNGVDLPGATNAVLNLTRLGYDATGYYSVKVSNPLGEVLSAKAFVNVAQVYVGGTSLTASLPTNVPPGLTNVSAASAGDYHVLALKRDGSVAVWISSDNYRGLTNVPPSVTNVVAVASGSAYCLALRSNGTVVVWGSSPVINVPANLSNVVAVAAGLTHAMALKADGSVAVWGSNTYGQTDVPAGLANVVSVAAGANHCLALKANGSVVAWGQGSFGQTNVPATLTNLLAIAARGDHSLGLKADGTLAAWGSTSIRIPTNLTNVVAIAAGAYQDVALRADGRVLLLNAPDLGSDPGLSNVIAVAGSPGAKPPFYVAVLGNGTPVMTVSPASQTVPLGTRVQLHARAVGVQPMSYRWQFNGTDLFGATNSSLTLSSVQMKDVGQYRAQVSNPLGTASSPPAQLAARQLVFWGTGAESVPSNVPVTLKRVVAVAAGDAHVVALQADGTVASWAATIYFVPTNLPAGLTNVVAVSAGANHSLALKADGTVVSWGLGSQPNGLSNVVAISAGASFDLALKANGTVAAWGDTPASALQVPAGLSNVVAISAGRNHCLALKADGTVAAWGDGANGQTAVPRELSQVVAIAAGPAHSLALLANGRVVAWGTNPGQSVPSNLADVVAIRAGARQDQAIKADGSLVVWGTTNTVPAGLSNLVATANGSVAGYIVALLGDGAPAFTVQPGSQATTLGATLSLHARAVGVQPLRYQWWANGELLPGQTNASLTVSPVRQADLGQYQVVASNRLGTAVSGAAVLSVPLPLAVALNATNLVWKTSGAAWFGQARVAYDEAGAGQSGPTLNGQQSVLETTVTGPGRLTFWWKVSCEEGYDYLRFYLNDLNNPQASRTGESGWQQLSFSVRGGPQAVRWVYSKDASVSEGEDAGWVDQVTFTPDPPQIYVQPSSQSATPSDAPTFSVTAVGMPPLAYQWFKGGMTLPGATASTLAFSHLGRGDSGVYAVQVSNAGGTTLSSNATLNVRVPQRLATPILQPDGSLLLTARDADGADLGAESLRGFEVQTSSNLVDWVPLPDGLSLTNGQMQLRDARPRLGGQQFYRILER